MKNFFMTLMLCYLAINCKDCNTSFTLLNDIDAVDLSSNGPNTFFCTTTKQIVQMNYSGKILNNQIIAKKATEKCKSDTLPDCNRIEANYNGNFFVIDFSGNMFYIKVIAPETYAIECVEHSEKFVDVGCNINGICFAADEKNTLFRVNLINEVPVLEKYFKVKRESRR